MKITGEGAGVWGRRGSPFLKEWSSHSLSRGLVNKLRWQTPISTKSKSGSVFLPPAEF